MNTEVTKLTFSKLNEYPEVNEITQKVNNLKKEISSLKNELSEGQNNSPGKLKKAEDELTNVLVKFNLGEATQKDVDKCEQKIKDIKTEIENARLNLNAKEKALEILSSRKEDIERETKLKRAEEINSQLENIKVENNELINNFLELFETITELEKLKLNDEDFNFGNNSKRMFSEKVLTEVANLVKNLTIDKFDYNEHYEKFIFNIYRNNDVFNKFSHKSL
ncbi:MAG: hypothetical protein IPH62_16425 [Ignavibacteriae bacterium]|nr:hypothetical protein [Ignavibacteriota bacterium]